jgi:hypothetical protein
MKTCLPTLALIALGGCNTLAPEPPKFAQIGQDKFRVEFDGSEIKGANLAQNYCKQHGFKYAEVLYKHASSERWGVGNASFICMREGEHLTSQSSSHSVICVDDGAGTTICE